MLKQLLRNLRLHRAEPKVVDVTAVRMLISQKQFDLAHAAVQQLAKARGESPGLVNCLLGEIAFQQQDDEAAERHFRAALTEAPGLSDAHHGLSLVLHAQSQVDAALQHAQFAVNKAADVRYFAQLGLCHLALGNFHQAETALQRATRLAPQDRYAWNNLGIVRLAREDSSGARSAFIKALELDPNFDQAAANLRQLEADLADQAKLAKDSRSDATPDLAIDIRQHLQDEVEVAEQRCAEAPDDRELVAALYRAYARADDPQSGIDALEAFRARHPDDIDTLITLGIAYVESEEYRLAKPLLLEAIAHAPHHPDLLAALADVRREQSQHAEALVLMRQAVALDPNLTRKAQLASLLVNACHFEEALAMIDELVGQDSAKDAVLTGLRISALTYLGRHEEALPLLDLAIEQSPNEPNRRFPRATIHLLNERFDQGWDDYAYRHLSSTKHLRVLALPVWQGESLEGKSLLILAEQGLGDQVMFSSCIPDVLALGPTRLVVEAIDRVAKTLARSFPACEVIASKQDNRFDWIPALGKIDLHIAMGDLPRLLRRSRADFPHHAGYLVVDAGRQAHWHQALQSQKRLKIGFSWRGGTQMTRTSMRTMDITSLLPLMQQVDANWVCLQYGEVKADLEHPAIQAQNIRYWPEAISDLDDFAALISCLDLVVTVCNTTVHYAGAVGTPVWVMAPRIPEWRYGAQSTSMPWYPSSRVYRQQKDGDWDTVITEIGRRLSQLPSIAPTEGACPEGSDN